MSLHSIMKLLKHNIVICRVLTGAKTRNCESRDKSAIVPDNRGSCKQPKGDNKVSVCPSESVWVSSGLQFQAGTGGNMPALSARGHLLTHTLNPTACNAEQLLHS